MKRHPFDNRSLYRLVFDGDTVAEGYGYNDHAFDALIDYANKHMDLGIHRTGPTSALSAGGSEIVLEVA